MAGRVREEDGRRRPGDCPQRKPRQRHHVSADAQYDGKRLDQTYVQQRARWEPLYEATQIKGDGETHPFLSPDDEFADYETWAIGNLDVSEAKTNDMLAGEYAREALKRGLAIEARLGTNPYKFGMIGSTDSHTSLATAEEDNFFGKHTGAEPAPERMSHPFMETDAGSIMGWQQVASGLAAVWARRTRARPSSTPWRARRPTRPPAAA